MPPLATPLKVTHEFSGRGRTFVDRWCEISIKKPDALPAIRPTARVTGKVSVQTFSCVAKTYKPCKSRLLYNSEFRIHGYRLIA